MKIVNIVNLLKYKKIRISETVKILNIEIEEIDNIKNSKDVYNLLNLAKKPDTIKISISYYDEYEITITKDTPADMLDEFFEIEKECVNIRIYIIKTETINTIHIKYINIYYAEYFEKYLNHLEIKDLISSFNILLQDCIFLIFKTDDKKTYLKTNSLLIGNNKEIFENYNSHRLIKLDNLRKNLSFNGDIAINVLPEDFNIIDSKISNSLENKFLNIKTILSIIYFSDNSLVNKNQLTSSVYGKKRNYDLKYINDICFKLYQWIFENENYYDKLVISKNILSTLNTYDISEESLNIILSNYSLLQRKNIDKYFELKKDLANSIIENSQNYSSIVHKILSTFSRNLVGFLGFIFTIVIVNVTTTRNLQNIFTEDIITILYILFFSSYLILLITIIQSKLEINKIQNIHDRLENNYLDIFKEETISLFKKDGFVENKKSANRHILMLSIVWFVLVTLAILSIDYFLGDQQVFQLIKSILNNL